MSSQDTRRIGEPQLNLLLAYALDRRHPQWTVSAEQTRTVRGHPGLRPDIIVELPGGQPLIIETEIEPAATVEQDAVSRLGITLDPGGDRVEQVIALRLPVSLTYIAQRHLGAAIERPNYRYATLSLDRDGRHIRWPRNGWLRGGVDDLANLCENIALSEQALAAGLARLEEAVQDIATHLRRTAPHGVLAQIADELRQEDGEQTSRMAAAIILNAATFHTAIAGHHDIPTVDQIRDEHRRLRKSRLLDCWVAILRVNYWPIFHIATRLLLPIPVALANQVLERATSAAEELAGLGVTTMHDLAGRMFQQLIADRKFLATFYTLPPSAAMIAELATARLKTEWGDDASVTNLRVADLACGTGTLLSAAYQAIRSRHRRAAGNDESIHSRMMEHGLIAADVMPQAAHLTASMLSSAHPSIPFGDTRIHTLSYGLTSEGEAPIGSLELLNVDALASLFPTGEQQVHGAGGEEGKMVVKRESLDLVIMNPPFTRPTNHENWKGATHPNFAGLGNDPQITAAMTKRLKRYRRKLPAPVGHGNAGLGSHFSDLAHLKLKEGGIMALVLPFAVTAGRSWLKLRSLLTTDYSDVTVVAIATTGSTDRAFSADTGMADAVIIATKNTGGGRDDVLYVSLRRRPESLPEAVEIARLVSNVPADETHGYLTVGDDLAGVWIRGQLAEGGAAAALAEPGVAATMTALPNGRLVLPRRGRAIPIPMTTLAQIGKEGLVDRDIGFKPNAKGETRGPFVIHPMSGIPDYPVLWGHSAQRERTLVLEPDSRGVIRTRLLERALAVWNTATRLHFNRDFRLNSQSLAAGLTLERTIGGRAWPSFQPDEEHWTHPLLLWANTTLGLMCFWWTGSRQQQGRAVLTITALPDLPVLDPRRLDESQFTRAKRIFDDLRGETFLPANEVYRDEVRQELDRAVLIDLLHLPEDILEPLELLRLQWCSEPSVHGGKSTRPV